jgi:hypothetical protein
VKIKSIARLAPLAVAVAAFCFAFSGCIYQVPITAKPTRQIDERFLGNWTSKDGKSKMKVVKLDDSNYIVLCDGDLYRAYHSDLENTPFVTVQILDSQKPQYSYFTWKLSDDGTLSGRRVNDKIVPDDTKDSATVRKLLKQNLHDPALFEAETQFTKDK